MQALTSRLQQLENATGTDYWEILKAAEEDLRADAASLNTLATKKEMKNRELLSELREKRKELGDIKKSVESLKIEYLDHIENVKSGLAANGLDMKRVVEVFEKVLADSLSEKKTEIIETINCIDINRETSVANLREPVKRILQILDDRNGSQLRSIISEELRVFHEKALETFRLEFWSALQKEGLPMKPLNDPSTFTKTFLPLCQFSCDLDHIQTGNASNSSENLVSTVFGYLTNLCVDLVEKEKGDPDFEWILMCAHKWAKNLKEFLIKATEELDLEGKEVLDEKFVSLVHAITKIFVQKNLKDPLIFSKLAQLFRQFEETCDFDVMDKDLFEPLYEPEFMSKWILLEVEIFTLSVPQLLAMPGCFDPISATNVGSTVENWASEVTVFFEEWLTRIDKDVSGLGNVDVQRAFYEALHVLMLDLCSRIHVAANYLYSEPGWSNTVFLVMNTVWQLRQMIANLTVTWPVSSFEVEKAYDQEWHRLGGMISDYLNDLVAGMDRGVRTTYGMTSSEKIRILSESFLHILKCLHNVSFKASQPSRSPLLNILTGKLFRNLQTVFDRWQNSTTLDVLGCFYTRIYSNLLPQLDAFVQEGIWNRDTEVRAEICQLDALMKVATNRDPSGELVRTAFKSIDEEQVMKMLGELGIPTTSDHAFQDYQILAENWEKIRDKGYGYGV